MQISYRSLRAVSSTFWTNNTQELLEAQRSVESCFRRYIATGGAGISEKKQQRRLASTVAISMHMR